MMLQNKIPEIFSRIEKFRKIQEPIRAELGLAEEMDKLEGEEATLRNNFGDAMDSARDALIKIKSAKDIIFNINSEMTKIISEGKTIANEWSKSGLNGKAEGVEELMSIANSLRNDLGKIIRAMVEAENSIKKL